jgi:hypothetical protein
MVCVQRGGVVGGWGYLTGALCMFTSGVYVCLICLCFCCALCGVYVCVECVFFVCTVSMCEVSVCAV